MLYDIDSAFSGVAPMTEEHISLALAFDVPIIIVVTKIDIANVYQIDNTVMDIQNVLTQPGRKRVSNDINFSLSKLDSIIFVSTK